MRGTGSGGAGWGVGGGGQGSGGGVGGWGGWGGSGRGGILNISLFGGISPVLRPNGVFFGLFWAFFGPFWGFGVFGVLAGFAKSGPPVLPIWQFCHPGFETCSAKFASQATGFANRSIGPNRQS